MKEYEHHPLPPQSDKTKKVGVQQMRFKKGKNQVETRSTDEEGNGWIQ